MNTEYLKSLAEDTGGETGKDILSAAKVIEDLSQKNQELLAALEGLKNYVKNLEQQHGEKIVNVTAYWDAVSLIKKLKDEKK